MQLSKTTRTKNFQRLAWHFSLSFIFLTTSIATVMILMLFAFSQWGYVWHFLYGDEVSFTGWKIPIPKNFYVWNRKKGLAFWKTDFGVPIFSDSYGLISLGMANKPIDYETDFDKFVAIQITLAREDGIFGEVNRKEFPQTPPRYCVEFLDGLNENALSRCIVDGTRLTVWYSGNAAYLPAFYSTVRGLSRIPTKENPVQTTP